MANEYLITLILESVHLRSIFPVGSGLNTVNFGKRLYRDPRPEWQSMLSALATAAGQMRIWILHSYSELDFGIAGLYRDEQRGFECFAILWLWEYECEDERSHRKCDYTVGQGWKPSLGCLAHTDDRDLCGKSNVCVTWAQWAWNNQLLSLFVSPTASQTISHSFGRAIYYGSHMAGADGSGIPVVRPALELANFASRPSNIK